MPIIINTVRKIGKLIIFALVIGLFIPVQFASAGEKNLTATITDSDTDDSPATVSFEVSTGSNFSTSTTSGDESTTLSGGSGNFSKSINLYPIRDTVYYWHAKAKDKHGGESAWTKSTQFSVKGEGCSANTTAPDKIKNLSATAGNQKVTLRWSNPTEITSLKLHRSEISGEAFNNVTPGLIGLGRPNIDWSNDKFLIKTFTDSSASSYVDSGLKNGTTYYYVIKVTNECKKESQSNEAKAIPLADINTLAVTLIATCADKQNNLSWTNPSGTTKTKLYRSESAGEALDNVKPGLTGVARINQDELNQKYLIKTFDGGKDTSYNDTGLENGKLYYYILQALNNKNKEVNRSSEISAAACAPDQDPPSDPTDLDIINNQNDLVITWIDPTDEDLNFVNVYRSLKAEKGEKIALVQKSVQVYTDSNVEPGKTYYYTLTAVDKSGMESKGTDPQFGTVNNNIGNAQVTSGVSGLVDKLMGDWQDNSVLVAAARNLIPFSIALPVITSIGLVLAKEAIRSLINGSNLYNFIHYIFLGGWTRRRKRPWGICLSLTSQLPIAGVLVQLMSATGKKIIDKTITNKFGKFVFLIKKPGSYQIVVSIRGYERFVSQELNIKNINNAPQDMVIHLKDNLGLAQFAVGRTASALILLFNILNHLRMPINILGTILAIYQVLIVNDNVSWLILLFYIVVWIIEIGSKIARRTFGLVSDIRTGKALSRAIVRFFKIQNGNPALVATAVTTDDGAFRFLLNAGQYQCGAVRIGYNSYTSKILTFNNNIQPNLNIRLESLTGTVDNQERKAISPQDTSENSINDLSVPPPAAPKPPATQGPKIFEDLKITDNE